MKKKIVVLIFFTLSVINTIIAGLWISGIGGKIELLVQKKESAMKLNRSLYDNTSFKLANSKLEEEISIEKALKRKEGEALKMTEEVLRLLKQNRIKMISYRLEGEELTITTEGDIGSGNQDYICIISICKVYCGLDL